MIGSKDLITQEYFISSENEVIHKHPVNDGHVTYRDEELFKNLDELYASGEEGLIARYCQKCLKESIFP